MKDKDIDYGVFVGLGKAEELEEVREISIENLKNISSVNTIKNADSDSKDVLTKVFEKEFTNSEDVLPEEENPEQIFDWEVPFEDEYKSEILKQTLKNKKKNKKNKEEKTFRVTRPIGLKMIFIISSIVIISLSLVTFIVSYSITQDTRINAEDNNRSINRRSASDCSNRLLSIMNNSNLFYDLCQQEKLNQDECNKKANLFFERNSEIALVMFLDSNKKFLNNQFFVSNEIDVTSVDSYIYAIQDEIDYSKNGITTILNASTFFSKPMISVLYRLNNENGFENILVVFSSQSIIDSFSSGSVNTTYFVNEKGDILASDNLDFVLHGKNIKSKKIITEMTSSKNSNKQISYVDTDGVNYISAFSLIENTRCGVITEVQVDIILEGINKTTRQNIYLSIAILSLAILIVWIFSRSLSTPLKKLTAVTNEISKANFNTEFFEYLNDKRKDEIGALNNSTKLERDILNTFTKLTNKGVTKAIVLKKIDFNPHLKDITVLFSDIRGFTAISDSFNDKFREDSAAHIINFLNDYMSRMVNCIVNTDGVIDKFEGDAIMAAWGVLRDDNLDYESLDPSSPEYINEFQKHITNVKEDAINSITAACAMRYALMEYNKKALAFTNSHKNDLHADYKPQIKIGCGINTGRATVGFMGSTDKMEFTSIGDSVNFASRTESSNKPCGTDVLITQDTYDLIKKDYIKCPENNFTLQESFIEKEIVVEKIPVAFEVKGKGKQYFYGVVNMPNFDIEKFFRKSNPEFIVDLDCSICVGKNGPKNLSEVRKILGIPTPDFSGVNLEKQEEKVQIQHS